MKSDKLRKIMTYSEAKTWCQDHRKDLIYIGSGLVLFVIGLGAGLNITREKLEQKYRTNVLNYTTQPPKAEAATQAKEADTPAPVGDKNCAIKGNISSKGNKIYHVPGGRYYATVKPEQCFATEAEAKQAGFRKSGL